MRLRYPTEMAATFFCAVFFGAALYISVVQHPAALQTGTEFALRFFPPMYNRAAMVQASLAILGAIAAFAAYFLRAGWIWLAAGILIVIVIPVTLVLIDPVNRQLKSIDPMDARAMEILDQWGRLHWLRTIASGASFVLCLAGLSRRYR